MGRMLAPLFDGSPLLVLPLLALVLFFGVFLMTVVQVFRQDRATLDALARQPLDDEVGES